MDYTKIQYVHPGERFRIEVSFSEVCMHMRVAGRVMGAELLPSPGHGAIVQLYQDDGSPFSAPILTGEAGVYQDSHGYYIHPVE